MTASTFSTIGLYDRAPITCALAGTSPPACARGVAPASATATTPAENASIHAPMPLTVVFMCAPTSGRRTRPSPIAFRDLRSSLPRRRTSKRLKQQNRADGNQARVDHPEKLLILQPVVHHAAERNRHRHRRHRQQEV